jgi:MFS family permease
MDQPLDYSPGKITLTLLASQAFSSASIILLLTVASIEAVRLGGGDEKWTGIPSTLMLVAQALAAFVMGRLMDRIGRRAGLSLGHAFMLTGAVVAGFGALMGAMAVFLAGIFVLGLASGTLDLGRYAAADANPPERRSRSISLIVLGGTVGSLTGPSLIALARLLAGQVGIPERVGVWPLIAVFATLGAASLMLFLRPDPAQIVRRWSAAEAQLAVSPAAARSFWEILRNPRARLAVGGLVFGQLAMVTVMTITPVHIISHQHGLEDVSLVLMGHTLGMFGFSFFTGWLADRSGRAAVILVGGLLLGAACVLAPFQTGIPWLAASLFVLGLGWNFSFVASSSLLDETLQADEKGVGRGTADALVKVASGAGSLGSGLVFAASGFAFTSWLTVMVAMLPAVLAFFLGMMRRPVPAAESALD